MSKEFSLNNFLVSTEIQPLTELAATTLRIGIVASRFNKLLVEALLIRVLDSISTNGAPEFLCVERVPGAHEIPSALSLMLRSESFSCMIGLGVIIKGSTSHHHMVADTAGHAIQRLAINHHTPIINGIVVTDNVSDAEERITGTLDRGQEFAHAAIEMGHLQKKWTKT